MTVSLGVLLILLAAALGAPLFVVIVSGAMLGFHFAEIDLMAVAIEFIRLVETPILIALPFFTLTGCILAESRTSSRLVRLARALVGWMPGGLTVVTFLTCAFFTAFTGASGVTIVAIGGLMLPMLRQAGYPDRFSLGLLTSSGSLGLLLPPSLPLILYGIVAQQLPGGEGVSIQNLFLAGLLPAALMVVVLSLWSIRVSVREQIPLTRFSISELCAALWDARWELPMPIFVFGGIYGGFFAVSEAAAVTALYVIVAETLFYREIAWRDLPRIMREAMVMVGGILIILGVALAFTNVLIDAEVPTRLFQLIQQYVHDKYTFLLLLNLFLLVLGCMLDIFSAIIIMVPLLLPMAINYGVHPVHLGIIFLANLEIGYFTPPLGLNLFMGSFVFKRPMTELAASTLPFMLLLLLVVLVITYVPALSLMFIGG